MIEITPENDITITVTDARNYFKGCIPGWRSFADAHGFNWKEVTRHGLKASQLVGTKDAMAISLVEHVYRSR